MKIFDFTGGNKGPYLGEVRTKAASFDGKLPMVTRDNQQYRGANSVTLADKRTVTAEAFTAVFGVEAVCFCTGKDESGNWDWRYVTAEEPKAPAKPPAKRRRVKKTEAQPALV